MVYLDYMDITDAYLGDLIEHLVTRHYSDYIDLAEEYGEILEFISRELVRSLCRNGKPSPSMYESRLKKLLYSSRRYIVSNVVSYLLSRYLEYREMG